MIAREMNTIAMNTTAAANCEYQRALESIRDKAEVGNFKYQYNLRTTNALVTTALIERLEAEGFTVEYDEEEAFSNTYRSLKISWDDVPETQPYSMDADRFNRYVRDSITSAKVANLNEIFVELQNVPLPVATEVLNQLRTDGYSTHPHFTNDFPGVMISWAAV